MNAMWRHIRLAATYANYLALSGTLSLFVPQFFSSRGRISQSPVWVIPVQRRSDHTEHEQRRGQSSPYLG
jgi:hypothetical protein